MVKKRCVRTPTANRIKTEDKEAKSPQSGDDVMVVARDRLKGALQDLMDHSDDDSESSQEDRPSTPLILKSQIKREPRQPVRRRRKKVIEVDQAFHHTFVMKLFDRSVDLAQFTEDTPLYPICRAWMANQPRTNYNNSLPNTPVETSTKIKEENGSPSNSMSDIEEVHQMPPPVGQICSRIPSPEPKNLQDITPATFEMNTSKAQLLGEHMERWGKVRRKWLTAAQANEARYAESGKILSDMFKDSQKSYL